MTLPAKPGAFGRVPVVVTRPDDKSITRAGLFYYYSDRLSLRRASQFGDGSAAIRATSADLNGDGKPDYVYLNYYSRDLGIALAGSTGLLQEPKLIPLGADSPTDLDFSPR